MTPFFANQYNTPYLFYLKSYLTYCLFCQIVILCSHRHPTCLQNAFDSWRNMEFHAIWAGKSILNGFQSLNKTIWIFRVNKKHIKMYLAFERNSLNRKYWLKLGNWVVLPGACNSSLPKCGESSPICWTTKLDFQRAHTALGTQWGLWNPHRQPLKSGTLAFKVFNYKKDISEVFTPWGNLWGMPAFLLSLSGLQGEQRSHSWVPTR